MNTTLHVTIDKKTKEKASTLAKEMGLDLSSIVRASINTFVQTETFHVDKSERMTPYLELVIDEAFKESKTYGPFKTAGQSIKFLRSRSWK